MSIIDDVLLLLKDGDWHRITEVAQEISLSKDKTEKIVGFLKEYEFVKLKENMKEVRIQPTILEFLEQIQRLEKEPL